ncbi:MAG TPA: hypothetical protein VHZ50_18355 [Puia sp.]|nr:hypothetical protein [Puia sp.]
MKGASLTITLLVITAISFAQGVFSNKTNAALEKVIQDYPNRFNNIKGTVLIENPQSTEYNSTVQIPGSNSCIVTRYNSPKNDAYGWSCVAFENEDFDQVKSKFKELFGQIKNSIVKLGGSKPFILTGTYVDPDEAKKFTTILFELLPSGGDVKNLKVDLSIQYIITGWKISLSVYDHEAKEGERNEMTSN